MAKALKLSLTISIMISACLATIKHTSTLDTDGLASYDLDAHLIKQRLDKVKQERLSCFYRQGVNDQSFESCCGEGYSKLENVFVNHYRILEQQLEDSFNNRIATACIQDTTPCQELSAEFSDSIRYDRDLYEGVSAKKVEIERSSKVDKRLLDTAFNRFEKNYNALMNARVLISNAMKNTVEEIQNFIDESKIDITHDYKTFHPNFIYKAGHDDESGINEDHLEALRSNVNDFNASFLAEGDAKRLVAYYVSNGFVKSEDIDTEKIPSEQLQQVKEIMKSKNDKLKL